MTAQTRAGRLRGWAANTAAVLLGFLIVAIALAAAEGALRLKARLLPKPPQPVLLQSGKGMLFHEGVLGRALTRDSTVRLSARLDERLLYDVSAKTDSAGRRVTPCDCPPGEDVRIAAFFGCSMTFGQGVEDHETLPARFCAHNAGWQAHNYGVSGYGPQHMWLHICKLKALKEFSGRTGVVVYSYIDHHLQRLVGAHAVVSIWNDSLPWLEVENGRIVHCGTFWERSPLMAFYYRHIRPGAHLALFLENHLPRRSPGGSQEDAVLDLLTQLVVECGQETRIQAPGLTVYVLILPTCGGPLRGRLLSRLEKAGIRVLDYESLFEETHLPEEDLFFHDSPQGKLGHFKATGYDIVARRLVVDAVPAPIAPDANLATPPAGGAKAPAGSGR